MIGHSKSSITTQHQFIQERPSPRGWTLWRKACLLWSTEHGKLRQPLGQWQRHTSPHRRGWPAHFVNGHLYVRVDGAETEYREWTQEEGKAHYTVAGETIHARDLPHDAAPTDVQRQFPTSYSVLSTTTYCQSFGNLFEAHHDTINAFFESLEPWEAEMLSRTHFQADVGNTAAAISQPSIVACDGPVNKHKAGAFGWVFSDRTGNRMVLGSGPARGSRITSYRSEGYGILAVTRFLHRLQEYTARSPQRMNHLQIVCDNLSMVRNVHKILPPPTSTGNGDTTGTTHYTVLPLQPEWDVLNEIWHTTKHWHGIRIAHVKGHQDAATPAEQLSIEAILNMQADSLAG